MKLAVFDIETNLDKEKHFINSIGVILRNKLYYFSGLNGLYFGLLIIFQKNINYIYTHNFANFDSFYILKAILRLNILILKVFIKNNSILFLKINFKNKIFYFIDSF